MENCFWSCLSLSLISFWSSVNLASFQMAFVEMASKLREYSLMWFETLHNACANHHLESLNYTTEGPFEHDLSRPTDASVASSHDSAKAVEAGAMLVGPIPWFFLRQLFQASSSPDNGEVRRPHTTGSYSPKVTVAASNEVTVEMSATSDDALNVNLQKILCRSHWVTPHHVKVSACAGGHLKS